jgi:uncharacterized membrane protein YphA (DoxX/SURF4 family)
VLCAAAHGAGRLLAAILAAGTETTSHRKGRPMNINLTLAPLMSLIAGILILTMPRLLNYIVAIYLIVIGLIGIFGAGNLHLR